MTAEPKTKQIALSKGFVVGGGILNLNVERARSITDIASPYTAYDRNNLNVTYWEVLIRGTFLEGLTLAIRN